MEGFFKVMEAYGVPTTWDVGVLVLLIIGALVYGYLVGRDRAIITLVSSYIALAVVTNTPLVSWLNRALRLSANPMLQVIWFLACFILVFGILYTSPILKHMASDKGTLLERSLFAILQVGLLASIVLFLLPDTMTAGSGILNTLFGSPVAKSIWLIGPVIFLATLGRVWGD